MDPLRAVRLRQRKKACRRLWLRLWRKWPAPKAAGGQRRGKPGPVGVEVRASRPPPPPADDEFMTALQSLMPASGNGSAAGGSTTPKEEGMPPALAAIVAEVDSRMLV